jgi:phosphoglycolate phosphatase
MGFGHIIFDFDGTIVQSRDLAVRLFNEFAGKYGYRTIGMEEIEYLSTLSIRDRIQALGLPMYKLPQVIFDMKRSYKGQLIHMQPVDGIRDIMDMLKQRGIGLGIISSNTRTNIDRFLQHNRFPAVERVFCASNIFGKDKVIAKYIRAYGLKVQETLYIGDELRDVLACRKAGVPVAAVAWGYDSLDLMKAHSPDFALNTPSDIVSLLRQA